MPRVYVSIGSNIDREHNIRGAIRALREAYGPLTLSRVYESAAEGFEGGNFYNLVAAFDTEEPPRAVNARLARIEHAHGRTRRAGRYGSRTLDIDLLLYDDRVLHEDGMNVPRDEIEKYAFVLRPLAEIAPRQRHPLTGARFEEMWHRFDDRAQTLKPVTFDPAADLPENG